ncbi:hypothetical protein [Spirosoma litoris]
MKVISFLLFLLYATTAYAIRYEFGDQVTISQPVNGDLYVSGGTITINAAIRGDLIAAGGTITINDSVTNDILLVGGTVILNGYVGDDIRCLGGSLQILKGTGGDALLVGGNVTIDQDGLIGGSLLSAGGKLILNGQIKQDARLAFGSLVFNGRVEEAFDCRGGNATVNGHVGGRASLAANDLLIGHNAHFDQQVRYWNQSGKVTFGNAVSSDKTRFDSSLALQTGRGRAAIISTLWFLSMALLMIYLVQSLLSTSMNKAGKTLASKALPSLGAGFLFFITVPVATMLAYATLVGVLVGVILTTAYLLALMLATVITSVVAANAISQRSNKHPWSTGRLVLTAFAILILIQSIALVPFVGWLAVFVLICAAFGAILLSISWKQSRQIVPIQAHSALP